MTVAILQARFSSSRLPGKVLKPLLEEPMLARQIERINRATKIDKLIVATSAEPTDQPIADMCSGLGVACYRGSLEDVLDRFYQVAQTIIADHYVRLTGDCPLTDPSIIDLLIAFHLQGDYDYSSNTLAPTFPDGLDVEVMQAGSLADAWNSATLPSEREHVTPYIYNHPERFRLGDFRQGVDQSHMRWTVDEPSDFQFVEEIYNELYPDNPAFTSEDVHALLARRPELSALNSARLRNEGYTASLAKDEATNK